MRSACVVCGKNTNKGNEYCFRHIRIHEKRNKEFRFDFRSELLMLFYGESTRNDVTDEMLFSKVRDLLAKNSQLEREVRIIEGMRQYLAYLPRQSA